MNRVKEIFAEAVDRHGDDRVAYLDQACADNPELRAEVDAFLQAAAQTDAFGETAAPLLFERPGALVGRYKLLEQIGEGGFGVVFMAAQETPVRRRVAVKIIKLGMDTKQVIARFEAERQALAMMDHPGVARVFDGGATEGGRPYFVMELVKGIPITQYCDRNKVSILQRLELFSQVCQAVQHAHQKGLIHRDIKPSNVLVSTQDDRPVAKVIDFGIAKATQARLTEKTLFTEFRQMVGTPEYMSPEQADGGLDIDTRSDVYSLGVLLYELLVGSTPFDANDLRSKAFGEMQRMIREVEPQAPSTRLSTINDTLPKVAAQRAVDPHKLATMVRGELDWIAMKCLEKDRNRRYETANALAMDLARYLSDEPVLACPPSARYRFGKFARRHRRSLLAAVTAFAALLALVVMLAASNRAVTAERNAKAAALNDRERALVEAHAQRQRAEDNLLKARTAVAAILGRPATEYEQWSQLSPGLRKIFTEEVTKYYQSLLHEDSSEPSLRYETAVGYRSLGLLHVTAKDYSTAENLYRQSIVILEPLVKDFPDNLEYPHQLAYSHWLMGGMLIAANRIVDAEPVLERGAQLYEKLFAQKPDDPDYALELTRYYETLVLASDQRPAIEQQRLCQRVLDRLPKLPSNNMEAGKLRLALAAKLLQLNRLTEAQRFAREAIAINQGPWNTDPTQDVPIRLGHLEWELGQRFTTAGLPAQSEQAFTGALHVFEETAKQFPDVPFLRQELAFTHRFLADLTDSQGRRDECERHYRAAIRLYTDLSLADPRNSWYLVERGFTLGRLASLFERAGQWEDAATELRNAIESDDKAAGLFPDVQVFKERANPLRLRLTQADAAKAARQRAPATRP